ISGQEAIYKTVRLLRVGIRRAGLAAHIFNDDQISPAVGLDSFISTATEDSREVFDFGRKIQSRLPNPTIGSTFEGQEQTLRKWIPGGTIVNRQRQTIDIVVSH